MKIDQMHVVLTYCKLTGILLYSLTNIWEEKTLAGWVACCLLPPPGFAPHWHVLVSTLVTVWKRPYLKRLHQTMFLHLIPSRFQYEFVSKLSISPNWSDDSNLSDLRVPHHLQTSEVSPHYYCCCLYYWCYQLYCSSSNLKFPAHLSCSKQPNNTVNHSSNQPFRSR